MQELLKNLGVEVLQMWPFSKIDANKRIVAESMKALANAPDNVRFFSVIKNSREALSNLPPEARKYLIPYLSHRNPWIRRYAGTALAVHMDDEVVDLLSKHLEKDDKDTFCWFISELVRSTHRGAFERARKYLPRMDSNARGVFFKAIRVNPDEESVALLLFEIEKEDGWDSFQERFGGLAEHSSLQQLALNWRQLTDTQKKWIRGFMIEMDADMDITGRQSLLNCLLNEPCEELVWNSLQALEPGDLSDAALLPVLRSLQNHRNRRIKNRAQEFVAIFTNPNSNDH